VPLIDEADLLRRLAAVTLKEKVALLAGADAWTLTPVPSAGLATLALSDGPVGPRGTSFGGDTPPSLLFPSPTSLAAAWDEETAREAGRLMGARAREMGIHVLLAPTVNLHRSPLGGRHFECYSEDPLLTARVAVGFIQGVQSAGVAATVKHFVGMSYTAWEYLRAETADDAVEVTLRNAGDRPGREVVQAYLEQDGALRLAGFAAAEAAPGQTITVRIGIAPQEPSRPPHRMRIGRSASDLPLTCTIN
jgi:hypothetical protein